VRRLILPLAAAAALGGCGGESMDASQAMPVASAPSATDFTAFVKQLLASRSDTSEPLTVSAAQFVFPDDDNPAAFATVLAGT
jgi:outer membrane PBP1 activator LpoA protein